VNKTNFLKDITGTLICCKSNIYLVTIDKWNRRAKEFFGSAKFQTGNRHGSTGKTSIGRAEPFRQRTDTSINCQTVS
jgi:hypothetical protein